MNENERVYWDVPLYAESNLVTANIIDSTIVEEGKREAEKKTTKYAPFEQSWRNDVRGTKWHSSTS